MFYSVPGCVASSAETLNKLRDRMATLEAKLASAHNELAAVAQVGGTPLAHPRCTKGATRGVRPASEPLLAHPLYTEHLACTECGMPAACRTDTVVLYTHNTCTVQ